MRSHPRIRKTIKWGGAVVTVLLVVVWVGSGWFTWGWFDTEARGFWIGAGVVQANVDGPRSSDLLIHTADGPRRGWMADRLRFGMEWNFVHTSFLHRHHFQVPLWTPVSLFAVATGFAWALDARACRRARLNLCAKCGYDRTGLASRAKCPECGAVPLS